MRNKGRGGFGQPLLFPWPLVQHARPLSDCQLDLWSVLDVGIWPGLNRELRLMPCWGESRNRGHGLGLLELPVPAPCRWFLACAAGHTPSARSSWKRSGKHQSL